MKILLIYSPYLVSLSIGFLLISLINELKNKIPGLMMLFFSLGLGLGISAYLTFLSFIFFNRYNASFVCSSNIILLAVLSVANILISVKTKSWPLSYKKFSFKEFLPFLVIILLSIPLWIQAHFYVFGGWDAWSAWNLKAKIMFLGDTHWKKIFSPILWRSSPHYPILLPLINIWGWSFIGETSFKVPTFTSYLFTLMTVGLLYIGLKTLTKSTYAILTSIVLITLPFYNKLAYSQYCDIVLSFYLLAGFLCLILSKRDNSPMYALLAGLFAGFLSFTKSEGLVASLIIAFLAGPFLFWKNSSKMKKKNILFFYLGWLLTIILPALFYIAYAPRNMTFENGLFSTIKPVNMERLKIILGFTFFEMAAPIWNLILLCQSGFSATFLQPKWNGLWVLIFVGLILSKGRCWRSHLIILPLFFILYFFIILFYYFMNTYFKIDWWLQVSLNRIIYALLPTALFWAFYSLFNGEKLRERST